MDFFKTSFWGVPIPMCKVDRILALKTQQAVNPDDMPQGLDDTEKIETASPKKKPNFVMTVGNVTRL